MVKNEIGTAGKAIVQAIAVLQTAFEETALLFKDFDEIMGKAGWNTAYGNRTTKEVTSNLNRPRSWLLQCSFRIYENSEKMKSGPRTRPRNKCCMSGTHNRPTRNRYSLWLELMHSQIALITGMYGQHGKKLTIQTSEETPPSGWREDWGFVVSERPLVLITGKEALKKLAEELLGYMNIEINQK